MTRLFINEERALADRLTVTMRGPKQNALFALWLLLRICGDILPPEPVSERNHRRRLQSFEKRITSLSFPQGLRRAIKEATAQLREGGAASVTPALQTLVDPVGTTLGPTGREPIARALRKSRRRASDPSSHKVVSP